jgi:hypothetical protein
MAYLRQAKTQEELKALTVNNVKKAYGDLAEDYNRLVNLDVIYCPCCGEFKSAAQFYSSKRTKSGIEHLGCKACILDMATDFDKKTQIRKDNREKTIEVFRKLDLPFVEKAYTAQLRFNADAANEKIRETAFQQYLVMVKSLPQYKGKTFADSEFDLDESEDTTSPEDVKIVQKTLKAAKKRFGSDFSNEDLMFLETEYQDWVSRYACDTKAQETIFERLAFKKWEINKATKAGASTKDLDRTYQDLLSSINILPRQNSGNGITDSLTFGQLIEKWEEEKPIPEPSPEFKDVDGIGKYIRVWFKGHLARALGFDNGYSKEYDEYIEQYKVKKPEIMEEGRSDAIYSALFGKEET